MYGSEKTALVTWKHLKKLTLSMEDLISYYVISWRLYPHWEAGETRGVRSGDRRRRGKFILVAWLAEEQEEVCIAGAVKAEEAGGEGAVLSHPSLPPKKMYLCRPCGGRWAC